MVKEDFQSAPRSLSIPMFMRLTRWKTNQCYSLRTAYLIFEAFQIVFGTVSLISRSYEVVSTSDVRKMKHKAPHNNGR